METGSTDTVENASPEPPRQPRGYDWIPVIRLEPGMVVARPVMGGSGQQMTIHLPAGAAVTASTISQLVNKGVECIAVENDAPPDDEFWADCVSRYESRLDEIFGAEPDEDCRLLLEALRKDGP